MARGWGQHRASQSPPLEGVLEEQREGACVGHSCAACNCTYTDEPKLRIDTCFARTTSLFRTNFWTDANEIRRSFQHLEIQCLGGPLGWIHVHPVRPAERVQVSDLQN